MPLSDYPLETDPMDSGNSVMDYVRRLDQWAVHDVDVMLERHSGQLSDLRKVNDIIQLIRDQIQMEHDIRYECSAIPLEGETINVDDEFNLKVKVSSSRFQWNDVMVTVRDTEWAKLAPNKWGRSDHPQREGAQQLVMHSLKAGVVSPDSSASVTFKMKALKATETNTVITNIKLNANLDLTSLFALSLSKGVDNVNIEHPA